MTGYGPLQTSPSGPRPLPPPRPSTPDKLKKTRKGSSGLSRKPEVGLDGSKEENFDRGDGEGNEISGLGSEVELFGNPIDLITTKFWFCLLICNHCLLKDEKKKSPFKGC